MKPEVNKKKRALRRWIRRATFSILALVALVLIAYAFRDQLARELVLPRILTLLHGKTGLDASVRSLSVELSSVRLEGVRLGDGRPLSSIEHLEAEVIRVSWSLWGAIRRREDFLEEILIEKPTLRIDLDRSPLVPAEPGAPSVEPVVLPELRLVDGDIDLRQQDREIRVEGIDIRYRNLSTFFSVRRIVADVQLPRLDSFPSPLEGSLRLGGPAHAPWETLDIERLLGGGEELVRGAIVELGAPDDPIRITGDFPWWSLWDVAVSIDAQKASIGADARGSSLSRILSLFMQPASTIDAILDLPRIEVEVPFDEPSLWTLRGNGRCGDVRLPGNVHIEDLYVEAARTDGQLRATVHGIGVEWPGGPKGGVEATALLGWSAVSGDPDKQQLSIEDLLAYMGQSELSGEGRLIFDESGWVVEDAFIQSRGWRIEDIAMLLPAHPAPGMEGSLEVDLSLGGAMELSSWEANGSIALHLDRAEEWSGTNVLLPVEIGNCRAFVRDALVERGEDRLRLTAAMDAGEEWAVDLRSLDGRWMEQPFHLASSRSIEWGDEWYVMGPVELDGADGRWTLRGRGSPEEGHLWELDVGGLSISQQRLASMFPGREEIIREIEPGAELSLSIQAEADWRSDLLADVILGAEINFTKMRARIAGHAFVGVQGTLRLQLDRGWLILELADVTMGEDRLSVTTRVPLIWSPWPRASIGDSGTLSAEWSFGDVAKHMMLSPDQIRQLSGAVSGRLEASATVRSDFRPALERLDGVVTIGNGTLKLFGVTPAIEEIQARVRVRESGLQIEQLEGRIGGNVVRVGGEVETSEPGLGKEMEVRSVDLTVQGRSTLLVRRPDLRVRGNVDLSWKGPWARSLFRGKIELTRSYYLADVRILTGGASLPFDLFHIQDPPLRNALLDVRIQASKTLLIKNNLIDARASADLRLGGTGLDPLLTGVVTCDDGSVRFANSRLDIRSALVEFHEGDPLNPRLQIQLGARLRGYDVAVNVTGSLETPEVVFSSFPSLDNDRLLLLVSTGYTTESIDRQGAGRVAAIEAAKYIGSSLAAYLSRGSDPTRESFTDRIRLETEAASQSELRDLIRVEYRVLESLLGRIKDEVFVQGERDFYGDYNLNLGWRFEVQ